ncbi:molybdopterin dinucleotide binding domain-containing protein [Thermocrinis minervae]|uniref:NADH-dependent fumarate reductase subunit C n=1 Tax=Thermocrinis minervae TaxID=381751 RepID=A0A1M6T215_9AQUI|nr:molybdopterin dinucleotide binding domain-containing protein [Thermocrinis minervae]SHK50949.1 NADH-dependent fumarate reductase subunit C [Thermocrinis minervae]
MNLQPTAIPLTAKGFDEQKVGFCAGCGCSCAYIAYLKDGKIVDLYGHPADERGMGSLCTKGIAYIQETPSNPFRLKDFYLKDSGQFKRITKEETLGILKEKLRGKIAFLLGRHTSLEDYLIAKELGDVYVDAPVVNFKPSTVDFVHWKDKKLIISLEAEPVFSDVMATRFLVDAVEKGSILYCFSSRYETVCAKAKKRFLLNPAESLTFLEKLLEPEDTDQEIKELKRFLYLLRDSLLLVGSHLLLSPFRNRVLNLVKNLRKRFGVSYSFVGDIMPYPAKELSEFNTDYDLIFVVGNLLKLLPKEVLKDLRFTVSLSLFPDYSVNNSNMVIPAKNFTERIFTIYRHAYSYRVRSDRVLDGEGYSLYELLKEITNIDVQSLYFEPASIEDLEIEPEDIKGGVYVHTENTLVEDLGHWYPWLHEMERKQKAYIHPSTYKKLGLKENITIGDANLPLQTTPNIAPGVVFIPYSYEEFQPFDPGVSPNAFLKKPYHRWEKL